MVRKLEITAMGSETSDPETSGSASRFLSPRVIQAILVALGDAQASYNDAWT